ncbi:MAG: cell division protein FtsQ/DivIB [Gammaproteobacteria bacterium]
MIGKRKKANRLRPEKKERRKPQLPQFRFPGVQLPVRALSIAAVVGIVCVIAWRLADRPVGAILVNAPFQRVTAMQIEEVVRAELGRGLLTTDLDVVRQKIEQLAWVDEVRLRRRWPDALEVGVSEQQAAARWGDKGLLNTRGELFIEDARRTVKELPHLVGPKGEEGQVAARYLQLHATLVQHGFQLSSVTLDERGSWRLRLSSGLEVRLGREQVDERVGRFLTMVTPLLAGRAELVDYIDMRYTNGFAIGWSATDNDLSGENKDA